MSALHAVRPSRADQAPGARLQGAGVSSLPRVVALGGGTGLPILLRGLSAWLQPFLMTSRPEIDPITAIVSVADDGGSSGRLRRAYRMPPLGDLRNCLLALADEQTALHGLFSYRFEGSDDVGGHSLGNLLLAALTRTEADLAGALARAEAMLGVRGRVLPASAEAITLRARFEGGAVVEGESRIALARRTIHELSIHPEDPVPFPGVEQALREADLIVLGPGSLYTSLLPVLLIPRVAAAIAGSGARVALVCNLLTEAGETDGFSAADFLMVLRQHVPELRVDDILLNDGPIPVAGLRGLPAGVTRVETDVRPLRFLGVRPVERDLAGWGSPVRHDSLKLGRLVLELALETPQRARTT
jgi:uncharacterized cofD-like protein